MARLGRFWTWGRAAASPPAPRPDRPPGPLVWAHCPDPRRLPSLSALREALTADGDIANILVTTSTNQEVSDLLIQPVPADTEAAATDFLTHWTPTALLWLDPVLQPALLQSASAIPSILAEMTEAVDSPNSRWQPRQFRTLITQFDHILTVDPRAAQRVVELGAEPAKVQATGPFTPPVPVLPCSEQDQRDTTEMLGPRPLWLAYDPHPSELADLAIAQRLAGQRSHRLMMVLATSNPVKAEAEFKGQRLNVINGMNGEDPKEDTQVYLVPTADAGLWFRLAPLCFLGGSLAGTGPTTDPLQAAAVGSVILHGPRFGPHKEALNALQSAGASRSIRNGNTLGTTLEELLAPDKVALMAHAAWDLTTQGADTMNRLVDILRPLLDAEEV